MIESEKFFDIWIEIEFSSFFDREKSDCLTFTGCGKVEMIDFDLVDDICPPFFIFEPAQESNWS